MFPSTSRIFLLGLIAMALGAIDVPAAPPGQPPATKGFRPPKERFTVRGHDEMIWAVAFAPDGKSLATASGRWNNPGQLRIWDANTGQLKAKVDERRGIRVFVYSPDGKLLLTADYFATKIALRDPATGEVRKDLPTPHANNMVAISPDGKTIAAALLDNTTQGWEHDRLTWEAQAALKRLRK